VTPGSIQKRVVIDRLATIDDLLSAIKALPLKNEDDFFGDDRNVWAAESCLRRSLEALFDIGRHILAKRYGRGVSEYKEIATRLVEENVLSAADGELLKKLAGYRNRMVHFYHEISKNELYEICRDHLGDVERVGDVFRGWLQRSLNEQDR